MDIFSLDLTTCDPADVALNSTDNTADIWLLFED